MKSLHFTKTTIILSLFTSLCATVAVNDGYKMYKCHGVDFYSESVFASAARAHSLNLGQVNNYPQEIVFTNIGGIPPYRIFPMVPDVAVYDGGPVSYFFIIVDRDGNQKSVVYLTELGYVLCD
ncbi:Bgt-50025 [Blumeria graminis f. sp. tritici]|uniref:Bgt-50025 n=2 Tax=Blumeria graminis TaxID=34373 RepID=A0A9X9PSA9_BLUGR|nr:Bgt-50025 [Blumeria graminis f. sp. tritici]